MSVVCGCLGLLVRCESSDALDGWLHDGLDINHSSRPHPLSPGAVSSYYSCSVDQASLCNLQGLDRSQAKSASQNFLAVAVASGCMQHGMQPVDWATERVQEPIDGSVKILRSMQIPF
jgi:hypothetical protein